MLVFNEEMIGGLKLTLVVLELILFGTVFDGDTSSFIWRGDRGERRDDVGFGGETLRDFELALGEVGFEKIGEIGHFGVTIELKSFDGDWCDS